MMIGDRLDNDISPARLLGWKTIRVLQGLLDFMDSDGAFFMNARGTPTFGAINAVLIDTEAQSDCRVVCVFLAWAARR
jgi:FMN phosphatase YigB (HAD superfamily)